MKIKWFGHACFLITSKEGTKILTDPFDKLIGYHLPETLVDIVTVSHNHYDHNNTKDVKGKYQLYNKAQYYQYKDITITGIDTFHDEDEGAKRGENIVFKYEVDGLTICHLGDLGHLLSYEQLKKLGHIDILLIPVGGVYTIDAKKAAEVVKQINPDVIVPMHYQTEALEQSKLQLDNVDEFYKQIRLPIKHIDQLDFNDGLLDKYKGIIALNY